MERVVERSNMRLAYQRVVENEGAAGVDEMPVPAVYFAHMGLVSLLHEQQRLQSVR